MALLMADANLARSSAGMDALLFSKTEASVSKEYVATCNSATWACVVDDDDDDPFEGGVEQLLVATGCAANTPCCLAMISLSFSRAPHPMGSELLLLLAVCDTPCVPSFCASARFQ